MPITNPADMHAAFAHAFNLADIDALMSLYESTATLLPPHPGVEATGHPAIRAVLQQFLALSPTMWMETTYVLTSGDIALTRAHWHLDGTNPEGQSVHMEANSIEVLRRQPDATWKIILDNPFGAS